MKVSRKQATKEQTAAKKATINYINSMVKKYGEDDVIKNMQAIVDGANKWYPKLLQEWLNNNPVDHHLTVNSIGIRFFIKTMPSSENHPGGPSIWYKFWLSTSELLTESDDPTSFDQFNFKDQRSSEAMNLETLARMNHQTFRDAKYDIEDESLCGSFKPDGYGIKDLCFETIFAWKEIQTCEACGKTYLTESEIFQDSDGVDLCIDCWDLIEED